MPPCPTLAPIMVRKNSAIASCPFIGPARSGSDLRRCTIVIRFISCSLPHSPRHPQPFPVSAIDFSQTFLLTFDQSASIKTELKIGKSGVLNVH
jgi:hypothetical protein